MALKNFLSGYASSKGKSIGDGLLQLIVSWDPEGATEGAIAEIEAAFDKVNNQFSIVRMEYEKEQREHLAVQKNYDTKLKAAEILQTKLGVDPTNTTLSSGLEELVGSLETLLEDVERERLEAEEAKVYMDELNETVNLYATKLKTARATAEKAKKDMVRAEQQKVKANVQAERARVMAGLQGETDKLSVALSAMNDVANTAKNEADAATRKAKLLTPTSSNNTAVEQALAEASGSNVVPTLSVADRLAALKNK